MAPAIACAHSACKHDAFASIMILDELTPLCRGHYEAHFSREARAYTNSLGLKTVNDMREWIKAHKLTTPPSKAWAYRLQKKHVDTDLLPIQVQFYQAVVGEVAPIIEELAA